jgi:uncharacterized protein (DUF58 family)
MISRETLKKLRKIEIRTNRLANDQLAGSYHSVFKGRGMAFSEVRTYQPGDDVRFIDWNVSARFSDVFVKLFTEEREMTVMLLVDLSASQRFGSLARPKLEMAAEVAALLAFSAIKNNDRVGLILFSDRVEKFVPPKKGKGHVLHVITEILEAKPEHSGTNLEEALTMLGKISRRRAVAFVVSDFVTEASYEHALRVASKRHDVIPIEVFDPREQELPDLGIALFEDLEGGQVLEVDTSDPAVREAYKLRVAKERARREQTFKKLKLDAVSIRTDRSYAEPIANLFRLRQKRMRGFG